MKEIQLTQGKVALVDDQDFEWINHWKWCAQKIGQKWYATRSTKIPFRKGILMHREIAKAPDGVLVDHINGDGLDNRRQNLRHATPSQNLSNRGKQANNTTGYKGVCWDNTRKVFRARVKFHGKEISMPRRKTAEEAARDYDRKAKELFGEFAHLNFPD